MSSSQLKAKLGKYMQAVRAGKEIIVTDRDRPVARLVPLEPIREQAAVLTSRPRDPSAPPLGEVEVKGIRFRDTDTTALLREDRKRR